VGRLLRQLGHSRQVMCVTHLPQVAAQAHCHLAVNKRTRAKTTLTEVSVLDEAARTREVARMLGGVDITPQTMAHAEEMIQRARS
jgi:DNA repair protein RecN (Recombination protein N)